MAQRLIDVEKLQGIEEGLARRTRTRTQSVRLVFF